MDVKFQSHEHKEDASRSDDNADEESEGAGSAMSDRVDQLIHKIRPTENSEQRRANVAHYVRTLVRKCFAPDCKVEAYTFGSVPLKTYLPDGDIDLSAFQLHPTPAPPTMRDTWANKMAQFLEQEQANPNAPFKIRDVQVIYAEVKLLKFLVDNIVVDVSFNQIGGLCTLNFLECVDRRIGRNHLFKRSIILVKAWCYYESRLLGAHHALLSTYALETLVLYIFNAFHKGLCTPLQVLQKFLDVFSAFDWDSYCACLDGRIPMSSLPNPVTERLYGMEDDFLLDEDFTQEMLRCYSPTATPNGRIPTVPGQGFVSKHLNICDVLIPNNNLGRSVSRASFARIRKALAHGSHTLRGIMKSGSLYDLDRFFRNTWNAQRSRPKGTSFKSHAAGAAGPDGSDRGYKGAFAVGQNHARAAAYSLPNLTPSLQQLMADGQQVAAAATALAAPPPPPPPPPRNQRNQRTAPAAGPADMKQSSSAPNFAAGWISQTQPGNDGSQAAAMHTPSAPPSLCWLDGEEPASNPGSQTPHLRAGDQPAPPAVPGASLPVLVGAVPGLYHAFATAPPPLPPGSSLPAYRPPPMQMFQPLDGVTGCSPGTPHPHLPPMPPAAAYMQHSPPGWLGPPGWDMALHLGQQDLLCGSLEDLTGQLNAARQAVNPEQPRHVVVPMALLTQLERAIIQKRQAVSMPLDPKLLSHMLPAHSMMPPFDPASFNMLLANSWANSGFPCPGVARPVQSPPANDQNTSTESNSSDAHQPAVSAQPLTRERIGSSSNQELNDVGKSGRPRVMADTSKPSISGAGSALANQKSRTQQDSAKPAQHEGATNAFVNAAKPEMRRIASEPSVGRHTGHHGSDVMRGGSPPLPGDAAGDQQQGGGKPARGGKAEPTFVLAEEDFPTLGNPATAAAQPRFPAGRPKFGDVAAKALTAGQTGGPAAGKAQMGQSQPSSSLAGGSPPISSNSEAQDIEDQPQPAPEVQGGMQLNEER